MFLGEGSQARPKAVDLRSTPEGVRGFESHPSHPDFRFDSLLIRHAIGNARLPRGFQGISESYKHRWSEALRHLLIEIKGAVDAGSGVHPLGKG